MALRDPNKLTLKEASQITGYHTDYLSYLIRAGKLEGEKIGRSWMTTRQALKGYSEATHPTPLPRFKIIAASTVVVLGAIALGWWMAWTPGQQNPAAVELYTISNPLDANSTQPLKFVGQSSNYKLYEQ